MPLPLKKNEFGKTEFGLFLEIKDPKIIDALKKLSTKQSERTYSPYNIKPSYQSNCEQMNKEFGKHLVSQNSERMVNARINNDLEGTANEKRIEEFVRTSQKFILENEKSFEVSRENLLLQTASTQTTGTSNVNTVERKQTKVSKERSHSVEQSPNVERCNKLKPHPPEGKKPVIKKHLSSQRMSR